MNEGAGLSVDSLLRGPMACAFFIAARRGSISAEALCDPRVAYAVAAEARSALDPWSGDFPHSVVHAAAWREEARELAAELLNLPGSSWWTQGLNREAQVLMAGPQPPDQLGQISGRELLSSAYVQSARDLTISATNHQGDSCWEVFADRHLGDEDPVPGPHRTLLQISPQARVYEIHAASDWQRLVHDFPLAGSEDSRGGLAPDWGLVAQRWDGVHLSFAGLLGTTYAGFERAEPGSVLWTWDREQTLWLGDVITAGAEIPAPDRSARVSFAGPLLADLQVGGTLLRRQN